MDSTIIKIISNLPSANADATFRRKVAYLSRRSSLSLVFPLFLKKEPFVYVQCIA
ncbi:MAG: hypothetical protein LBB88_09255 [Planctomycetaceae bacterium]|nr:hypothetical protein [Planctomycetaceae bacterium]